MADYFRKTKSLYASTTNTFGTGTGVTITPNSVSGLPTDTEITLTFDRIDSAGTATPSAMERIIGTVSGGNFVVRTSPSTGRGADGNSDAAHTAPVVEYIPNAKDMNDAIDGLLIAHEQTGIHKSGLALPSPVITTPQINDTSSDHQYVFAVSELTADRIVTLPLLTGADEFVFKAHTQTLTNKTFDITSAGNVVTQEFVQPVTWLTPGDTDDPIVFSEGVVRTLQGMKCICLGGGTIAVDLQECNSNATSCGTTGATFTCGATMTADSTLTDTSIASNAVVRLFVGAPSGTVDQIHCTVWGVETK